MRNRAKTGFARLLRRSLTEPETHLWFHLRRRQLGGFRFRRQHPVASYIADFACLDAKLIVELDGSQHLESRSDQARDAIPGNAGFRVIRFWNDDVVLRTDAVLASILATLECGSADQTPTAPGWNSQGAPFRSSGSFPRDSGEANARRHSSPLRIGDRAESGRDKVRLRLRP
jgi:very-short-patch-repair endonuclease